eukprot:497331-Prorocentrum_minimum.AAC.1
MAGRILIGNMLHLQLVELSARRVSSPSGHQGRIRDSIRCMPFSLSSRPTSAHPVPLAHGRLLADGALRPRVAKVHSPPVRRSTSQAPESTAKQAFAFNSTVDSRRLSILVFSTCHMAGRQSTPGLATSAHFAPDTRAWHPPG